MSKITTEQCKSYLIDYYKKQNINTEEKDWKRKSKYKDNNIVTREFTHPTIGSVILQEVGDKLQLATSEQTQPTSTSTSKKSERLVQRVFSSKDTEGAKNLLMKALELKNDDDIEDYDEYIMELKEFKKYQHGLPSQFYFHFSADTYENHEDNVTDGLNTPMVTDGKSFNVIFTDKNGTDYDSQPHEILNKSILPAWTSFCDEYHMELLDKAPKMSVKEFVQYLLELGFEYNPQQKTYDTCLFSEYIHKLNIEKEEIKTSKNDTSLRENSTIKDILKKDKHEDLEALLLKGLDIDKFVDKNTRIINLAYDLNSTKCIKILHDNNANVWLTNGMEENFPVAADLASSIFKMPISKTEQLLRLDELMEIMKNQKDNSKTHQDFLFKHKIFVFRFENKESFYLYKNKFTGVLTEEEINNLFLLSAHELYSCDRELLKKTVENSQEHELKDFIKSHMYSPDLLIWILQKRPMNMNDVVLEDKPIKKYVQEKIDEVKEDLLRSSRGFTIIYKDYNGNTTTQAQKYQESLSKLLQLQNAMNFHEFLQKKNKPN